MVADVFPRPDLAKARVVVANRSDGGILFWVLRLYGFAALFAVAMMGLTGLLIYAWFSSHAPSVPDFRTYAKAAPAVSRIYAADGTVLGEFAKEWREIVPFDQMPKQLVDAFLAVEDHDFYNHGGIYWKGIGRAVWANVSAGDFAQGGSTITQQVAKQFLGNEKSLARKGKEAIVARRLESQYSKNAILAVYLNHIYLGAGAWGVAAAAHRYFQKDLDQLTLAECAMIAGLAKAPSSFSPIHSIKLATERRNVVLDKMQTYESAEPAKIASAKVEPIKLNLYRDIFPDRMPYYAEHVRRYITDRYNNNALFANGLKIETAAEPTWEAAAYPNADFGARHQDKRQGWRGPEWRVDGAARETFIARQKQLYGAAPLVPDKRYLAVVDKVDGEHAEVLVGDRRLTLPLRGMRWASKWQPGNADNDVEVESATQVLRPGYVVWVSREIRTLPKYRDWNIPDRYNPTWLPGNDEATWDQAHPEVVKLDQVPHPQSAIFTADHHNGYVAAMVGGYDYDRSVFNRTVQACRQPGSTYKPIYYSLGLDSGFGYDSELADVPMPTIDPDTGEKWTPKNLDDTQQGNVSLEFALVFSKNVPSVDLFRRLGAKNVEAWARRLGFTTKIFADDALALGASCSKMDELARAFTMFARNGAWWPRPKGREKSWVYVRRIVDRNGNTIEDNTVAEDPEIAAGDRIDRTAVLAGIQPEQAIPTRAAFLTSHLLQREVEFGFANVLRATELKAAGKTGTSSATHDTWFIAYTSKFTTVVWMGDDKKERALGKTDAAYMTVVPLWTRYMYEAGHGYPNVDPYVIPPGETANDRGDHTKGGKIQMDLIWKVPEKRRKGEDAPSDDSKPPV